MSQKSQTPGRRTLGLFCVLACLPCVIEAAALVWGQLRGFTGKALRDGVDFWAGGVLAAHGRVSVLFDHTAYQAFIEGMFGKLAFHTWSYPPTVLLISAAFAWAGPWPAILGFDAASLALLALVLRMAGRSWWLILGLMVSPASLESLLAGQNAALMTALVGGGLLLLPARPRLGGALIGLASIKPQLGLIFPLFLLRRSLKAFVAAGLAALGLALAALVAFGLPAWGGFWNVTRPAMSAVLVTGEPKVFTNGLISVFAALRPLGLPLAFAGQGVVSLAAVLLAARGARPAVLLVMAALASPYLHGYDLIGVSLAIALRVSEGGGFRLGELVLLAAIWAVPGLLLWVPWLTFMTPGLLLLLLASLWRRDALEPCDSSPVLPVSPVSSAGRSPIPAPPGSTAPG